MQPRDIPALTVMCMAHAAYERSDIEAPDADRLHRALFGNRAKLHAWVATDMHDQPIGYATATIDFSTWRAREFMHLDCLYVEAGHRGEGIGRSLIDAVCVAARALELDELQWQTPQWNVSAQRFYERLGAAARPKMRFTLRL